MRLEIDVFGDVQFARSLLRFGDRAMNMRHAFDEVHDSFVEIEKRQFDSEGLSGSNHWTPLKASTVEAKAQHGLDPRILHATLAMRRSLTMPGDVSHVYRSTDDEAFFGSRDKKVKFHQLGTKKMPRRRPVELTAMERREWVKILQRYLVQGFSSE